jgi:hypothetical protein
MYIYTKPKNRASNSKMIGACKIVIEWRERELGELDDEVMGDPEAQQSLHQCILYKNFPL